MLEWAAWKGRFQPGGAEHDVYQDKESQRWFKVTKHGGLVIAGSFVLGRMTQAYLEIPFVREATPLEYLERLALSNDVLGDEVDLIGVTTKARKEFALITAQPHVRGRPATEAEITQSLAEIGFQQVLGVVAGRADSASYFRPGDGVAIFDAHGENFLWYEGAVFAIDALICRATPEQRAFLGLTVEQRKQEVRARSR